MRSPAATGRHHATPASPKVDDREDLPDAVRLVLTLPGGSLTRDLAVPPQPL